MINRIIKYRFWDFKEMITWDKINKEHCFYYLANFNNERSYIVAMQYTGLKDKNGKEIYEGDIVSIEYGKGVVEYSEKQAMFIINWIADNEAYNESLAYNPRNYIYGKTRKDIEIIGNIYENPEFTQSSE